MTTEDPRIPAAIALIEESMQWIEHDPDVCRASWAHRTLEKLRHMLLTPVDPVASPVAPELPYDHPSRATEDGTYTAPTDRHVSCDHCKNTATNADSDPYQRDVESNFSLVHFWCDDPRCAEAVESAQDASADEI